MESIYKTEIEGFEVEISYEFEEGDYGDYYTPPTPPLVEITGWKLAKGEKKERYNNPDLDDEEWEYIMDDIQWSVDHMMEEQILEYERKEMEMREQIRIEKRRARWGK